VPREASTLSIMNRYEARIPIEEQILSVIDQGPAIGADIRPGGQRFSWIDEGFDFGSQGIHLATEADAAQSITMALEIDDELPESADEGWALMLEGTAFWPVGELMVETADVERVPLAQVEPGRYQVRVWAKGIQEGLDGLEDWRGRLIAWSDSGRHGPAPSPEPSAETWLIQAVRVGSA
jgi:hypothetical protein